MSLKSSDFFVQRLKEWDVPPIYEYPCDEDLLSWPGNSA